MTILAAAEPMAKKKAPEDLKRTESVRISSHVLDIARIAASYQGKQVGVFISEIVEPIATRIAQEGHAKRFGKPK